MDRGWIDGRLAGLPGPEKPGAELALLTALASWRVDENLIARFRQHQPDNPALLGATCWGAYSATRRISSWIAGQARR